MNAIGKLSVESDRPTATTPQHAIRLLVLMNKCGEPVGGTDPDGAVKSIRSELRLQAMDFWMRNPDYLADELVTMVEQGQIPNAYFQTARSLLDDPEPDLHWYPMPRWFHGAFEKLDDAFALLETYGLALMTRTGEPGKKSQRNQFYLTEAGATAAADIGSDPVLNWYTRQVELVSLVAGNDVGDQLKARQYQQATYAKTELGLNIAPIAPRVRQRLDEVSARDSVSTNNAEGDK